MFTLLCTAEAAEGAQRFWSSARDPRTETDTARALAGTLKDGARGVWTSLKMVDYMHVPVSAGSFKYKVSVTGFILHFLFCLQFRKIRIYQEFKSPF